MSPVPALPAHRRSSITSNRLRRLAPLGLALWVNACSSWHPIDLAPTREFGTFQQVRIQRGDDRVTVTQARMVGDTLVGKVSQSVEPLAVPIAEIQRAETLKIDKGRTAVAMGVVLGLLAVLAAVAGNKAASNAAGSGLTW